MRACVLVFVSLSLSGTSALAQVHQTPASVEIRPDSEIAISLTRSDCYGSCPAYNVTVTPRGIEFDGRLFVVAAGKHRAAASPTSVRNLAERFVKAGFYSLDDSWDGAVDAPAVELFLSIDGRQKHTFDRSGDNVGRPKIVEDLEKAVDEFAATERWISGAPGLVDALRSEGFSFTGLTAQEVLKVAASRGKTETVRELLAEGVPIVPLPSPIEPLTDPSLLRGWLDAAGYYPSVLQLLIAAGASRADQPDKDIALWRAAASCSAPSIGTLLGYGANPNATGLKIYFEGRSIFTQESATALLAAARSGVRSADAPACVHRLAEGGANLYARDADGNTVLHVAGSKAVVDELLRLGADPTIRNKKGELPPSR
jgi:hypothetical protein